MRKLIIISMLLLSISFSHTFTPYEFDLSCPKNFTVTVGSEVEFSITIKNIGINDDKYNITVYSPPNILVKPQHVETAQISSQQIIKLNFVLEPLSAIGEKDVTISVTSLYSYRPESGIIISKSCNFRINLNYIKLGSETNHLYLSSIPILLAIVIVFFLKFGRFPS